MPKRDPDIDAPDRFRDDLHDRDLPATPVERELAITTAYELKDVNRSLAARFTDDDLKQIPVLREGAPLEQGATYLDLADARREAFKINGGHRAEAGHYYVPKNRTPYPIWNRLVERE